MDLVKIVSFLGGLSLSACSIGTDWNAQHCHVRHQTEIPLSDVPWTSPKQQSQEAQSIFPSYLALKKEQEQEADTLNGIIGDDEKS